MVMCELNEPAKLPKYYKMPGVQKQNYGDLENDTARQQIIHDFIASTTNYNTTDNVNELACSLNDAMRNSAAIHLPDKHIQPKNAKL